MQTYQKEFLDMAISSGVLSFGSFTLKSGRVSPYFFNAGLLNTGLAISTLAKSYARAISHHRLTYNMLFGPAYKGIPIVTATSIALSEQENKAIPFAYNRKEAKTHGEGGLFVGAPLDGDVLILDDVMTAGTAVRQSIELLERQSTVRVSGIVVALDRQEKGQGELSTVQELAQEINVPVVSIINLSHVLEYVETSGELDEYTDAIKAYRDRYGV